MIFGKNGKTITLEQDIIDVFSKHNLVVKEIKVMQMVWSITASKKLIKEGWDSVQHVNGDG
jgi:hypothetical protein